MLSHHDERTSRRHGTLVRVLRILLPAFAIGATVAPLADIGVASAALSSTFTYPTQSPNPVASGGTATYTGIVVTDSNQNSTVWVKLTANTLPTGASLNVLNNCLLEPGGSPNTVSFNAQITDGSASGNVLLQAQRWDNSTCTGTPHDNFPVVSSNNGTLTVAAAPTATVGTTTGI